MNILFLSPWLPWPPYDGARIRILETLRYLSERNRVTLLTTVRHPAEVEHKSALNGLCEKTVTTVLSKQTPPVLRRLSMGLVRGMPLIQSFHYDPNLAQKVRQLTSQDSYDIIHIEFPFLASYLGAVSARSRAKKVLSMHNIESFRFGRELECPTSNGRWLVIQCDRLFFESWEKKAVRQFDGISAVSELERMWIQQHAPTATVELVPNGVDTKYFSATCASKPNLSLVFTGLMDHSPNVDAVVWFCNDILPRLRRKIPDLSFKIVGSRPHPKVLELGKKDGVQVTGEVADVRPYLVASSALVVPLRSGGGTRLKILEAMAMGRPVISTTLGAEGLDVTPEVNILIADTPDQFVNRILFLLASPETANRLGMAGRQLVVEKYDWRLCLGRLENLYDKLLEATGGHRAPMLRTRQEPVLEA
jgi:sugar transferase (PEP-CTERM/EpsH1 system associated)